MSAIALFVLILFVYFIPTIAAIKNNHRNIGGIFVLNLFLGWTLLGWVIALVIAIWKEKQTLFVPADNVALTTTVQNASETGLRASQIWWENDWLMGTIICTVVFYLIWRSAELFR